MLLTWLKNNTLGKFSNADCQHLSDEQLMAEFATSGKKKWLNPLLSRHGDALYHFLLSLAGPDHAADMMQSTWLKVIEKRQYFQVQIDKKQTNFKAWLFTIARNTYFDHIGRSDNQQQALDETDNNHGNSQTLTEQIVAQAQFEQFNQLLESLPRAQKEAFMLQQEGFSLSEIATITGINQETVKTRLRYARNHFNPIRSQLREAT